VKDLEEYKYKNSIENNINLSYSKKDKYIAEKGDYG